MITLCIEEYTQIQTQSGVKQLQTTGEKFNDKELMQDDLWVSSTRSRKSSGKLHIAALAQMEIERDCFLESLGKNRMPTEAVKTLVDFPLELFQYFPQSILRKRQNKRERRCKKWDSPTKVVAVLLFTCLRGGVSREDRKVQALAPAKNALIPGPHFQRKGSVVWGSDPCCKVIFIKCKSFPYFLHFTTCHHNRIHFSPRKNRGLHHSSHQP